MWIAYYSSLAHIKLSVAAAVYYTIPLFITLFSALFTGDQVKPNSWLAIVLGFTGVLIIVRPDTQGFNSYVLLPLLAAILYALAMILTRTKCVNENPKVLSLSLNVTFIVMGMMATAMIAVLELDETAKNMYPFVLGEWTTLDLKAWIVMSILAIVIISGSLFTAIAYQNGQPSVIASFDYSYLGFSILWGLVFFSEIPDGFTITGIVMIAAAGLISIRK